MSKKHGKNPRPTLNRLELVGLEPAPPQAYGGVRLVPLIRPKVGGDLRLALKRYSEDLTVVSLQGKDPLQNPEKIYYGYVPHALVAAWSDDGSPVAQFGAQIRKQDGSVCHYGQSTIRLAHRMRRREDPNRLRFLPLHLAMEGFLDLHFGGPDIAWTEYSRQALSHGLGSRSEGTYSGLGILGLEDALRVFEIHEDQCGVLVYVADALASVFVVPHPEDYRLLHRSLIEDFYGELIFMYSWQYTEENRLELPMGDESATGTSSTTVDDLRSAVRRMREEWATFSHLMGGGLLDRPVNSKAQYSFGDFQLLSFISDLRLKQENHIGEAILRSDGTVEYLKTYRLSAAQTRRAYLLSQLADNAWNLDACAQALGDLKEALLLRLEKMGFGYLIHEHVLAAARKKLRKR